MADSLIAFRNGDRGEQARDGAILLAEGLLNLRDCSDFARAYSKALSRKPRRV